MSSDDIEKQELGLPRVDQMPPWIRGEKEKSMFDNVHVTLDCQDIGVGYAGCGSHQLRLSIILERSDLIEFLDKYNKERLTEDAGNGS